jgi:hypothetical protein
MGGSSMTLYQILTLIGVESIFSAVIVWVWRQVTGVRKGVQALLRAQMINDYNKWTEKGYAPIYARQNFENCWKNYHSLGANGVMDDLHGKFLELPTEERGVEYED